MKIRLLLTALLISTLALTSCKSREEKVIDKLDKLCTRIDNDGDDFDADDWADVIEELADIHEDMQDCDFTQEQLREVGKADGRLTAIIASKGSSLLEQQISTAAESLESYFDGFTEGASESLPPSN